MLSVNILFPVLNEERRLERGIERTCRYLQEHFEGGYELTIVDNGSTDRTEEISLGLCKKYPYVSYIKTKERGVGAAFREGVRRNRTDIVGYMDIDLSTDIRHLRDMYHIFETREEVEIVNASRLNRRSKTSGRKWYRNVTSYGFAFLVRLVFGIQATDIICGFKFFRKDAVEKLIQKARIDNGWFYIVELLVRAEYDGMDIYELPVRWKDDYDTKVHVGKLVVYYLKRIWRLKRDLVRDTHVE